MIVCISRTLRISADDGVQFSLQRLKVRESGSQVWENVSYHGNLRQAAESALTRELATGTLRLSVQGMIAAIDRGAERIERACDAAVNAASAAMLDGAVPASFPDSLFDE